MTLRLSVPSGRTDSWATISLLPSKLRSSRLIRRIPYSSSIWTLQLVHFKTSLRLRRWRTFSLQTRLPFKRSKSRRWSNHSPTSLRSLSNRTRKWALEARDPSLTIGCKSWPGEQVLAVTVDTTTTATTIRALAHGICMTRPWSDFWCDIAT